jgi:hypothetical protein
LYEKSLDKLVDRVKSYELRERRTVIKLKAAKLSRTWKLGFCRDMSLDSGVLGLTYITIFSSSSPPPHYTDRPTGGGGQQLDRSTINADWMLIMRNTRGEL